MMTSRGLYWMKRIHNEICLGLPNFMQVLSDLPAGACWRLEACMQVQAHAYRGGQCSVGRL